MTAAEVKPTEGAKEKTLWKHGAGVGAAVAGALSTLIAIGLSTAWYPPATAAGYLIPVAIIAVGAAIGALCGGTVGCAVPVVEPKPDSHHGSH